MTSLASNVLSEDSARQLGDSYAAGVTSFLGYAAFATEGFTQNAGHALRAPERLERAVQGIAHARATGNVERGLASAGEAIEASADIAGWVAGTAAAASGKADDAVRGAGKALDKAADFLWGKPGKNRSGDLDDAARARRTHPRSDSPPTAAERGGLGLRSPAGRHSLRSVKQGTVAKDLNTVVEPGVDVAGDVAGINRGLATRVGETFEINGRTYGVHDRTLFPISSAGFHQLNGGGFQALGVLNKFGDTRQAHAILGKMKNVGPDEVSAALRAWRAGQ